VDVDGDRTWIVHQEGTYYHYVLHSGCRHHHEAGSTGKVVKVRKGNWCGLNDLRVGEGFERRKHSNHHQCPAARRDAKAVVAACVEPPLAEADVVVTMKEEERSADMTRMQCQEQPFRTAGQRVIICVHEGSTEWQAED